MLLSRNKILVLGSFVEGAIEHQYVKALKKKGWNVTTLEIKQDVSVKREKSVIDKLIFRTYPKPYLKGVNEKITSLCKVLTPTVVLVFKGMEIWPETLQEIKRYTRLLCNYNPDHPFKFYSRGTGNSFVRDSIKIFDVYFSYSGLICKKLNSEYGVTSHCIPFGFDSDIIPNKFTGAQLSHAFIFAGAWDKERESCFQKLEPFPIKIFGPATWDIKGNRLCRKLYAGYPLFNQEYYSASFSALGVLNFLRPQNISENSHNMRTFEVTGAGGLLISNRTDEQEAFFKEGREAIYFSDLDELADKLRFFLVNLSSADKIKNNARQRAVVSQYSYYHRGAQLSDIMSKYVR